MKNILMYSVFSTIVISLSLFLISLMFVDSEMSEKSETSFECGFEPFFMPRIPFSMHFFSVTIVFLIFDLEVILLLPIIFKLSSTSSVVLGVIVIWLLTIGLICEWYDNSLSWQM